MNYSHFNSYSVKARMCWLQRVLCIPVTGKRDKVTIKALTKFQKDHGLVGNGSICEKTFTLLYNNGGSKINIRDKGES